MVALETLALALALAGASDTVLLEFSADWCGPCRSMEPTIRRLVSEGYPVRQVNVDQNPQLATHHGVTGVPCFVMLANGKEVDRVVGATSHARLQQMFAAAKVSPKPRPPAKPSRPHLTSTSATSVAAPRNASSTAADRSAPRSLDSPSTATVRERALAATVRLRVEDAAGHSLGTGTIIDVHGGEALVITCGHIFRETQGKRPVQVDLFVNGQTKTVAGQVISYDLNEDVGLVSILPGVEVTAMRVAPRGHRVSKGCSVFSVGCDRGADPSVRDSRVTAVNKYLGPPNVEVAGQPVQGRSGGGLFTEEGLLIGICNASDPADNEGIFAALPTIQAQLGRIGQQRIYTPQPPAEALASDEPAAQPAPQEDLTPPELPAEMPASSLQEVSTTAIANALPDDTEVIFIIRSRNRPDAYEKLYFVDHPSQELLEQIDRECRRRQVEPQGIALDSIRASRSPAGRPLPSSMPRMPDSGQIIRAQSADR
jgi:thiol-disulfide isomerase/thioredoxin